MKKISSYNYLRNETLIEVDMYHLSKTQSEFYSNIDFLYKCKTNPNSFECTSDWLEENFGVTDLDTAIKYRLVKEYEFLDNNGFIDYYNECGMYKSYTCTFVNEEIVIVECECYIDC